jgi:hypothetical protein
MTKRGTVILALVLSAPLLMGAGGQNPPGFRAKVVGPAVTAVVVMDPHMAGITTTAKQAAIRLTKGTTTSGAEFAVVPLFALFRGCDLSLTDTRFVYTTENATTLVAWVPQTVIDELFGTLGITVDATRVPVITDVDDARCTPDPFNPGPILDGGDGSESTPGMLSFQAVIQFLVPTSQQP